MKRLSLLFINVILFVLSFVVAGVYMLFPIVQVKVQCKVDADLVQTIMDRYGDSLGDYGDIDVSSALGDTTYTLSATVSINPESLINALFKNDTKEFATNIISETLDPVIDDLTDILVVVVKSVATTQVTTITKSYLTDYLNSTLSEGEEAYTEETVQEILESAGITDEYLDEQLSSVMDALEAEDASVDTVTDAVIDMVYSVYETASSSEDTDLFADLVLDEETEEQIRDEVTEVLNEIADEDGSISMDALLAKALEYLRGSSSGDGESEGDGSEGEGAVNTATAVSSVVVVEEVVSAETNSSDTKTQLKEELTEIISGYLTDNVLMIINIAVIALAVLLLFSCFTWLYIALKMLLKTFCKNPGVKLKLPIILGWLPFLLFFVLPVVGLKVLPMFMTLPGVFELLDFSFWTSGIIAFAMAVLMIIIWIPYGIIRKRRIYEVWEEKKAIREEKQAAKAEQADS